MKLCPNCGKNKRLSDFYRSKRNRDGHSHLCKKCTYEKVRAWQRAHPDQVRAQQRRYRLKHQVPRKRQPPTEAELQARRERHKQWQREYYRAHREELKAWRRAHRKKHRKEIRAYYREYYQANRAHLLMLKANYRKKRRAARATKKQA